MMQYIYFTFGPVGQVFQRQKGEYKHIWQSESVIQFICVLSGSVYQRTQRSFLLLIPWICL